MKGKTRTKARSPDVHPSVLAIIKHGVILRRHMKPPIVHLLGLTTVSSSNEVYNFFSSPVKRIFGREERRQN